jgi:hypothetical protein
MVARDIQARFDSGDITSDQADAELTALQECCSACCDYIWVKMTGVTSGTWDNSGFNGTHKLTLTPGSSCDWRSTSFGTRTHSGKSWYHKIRITSLGPTQGLAGITLIIENILDASEIVATASSFFPANDGCFDSVQSPSFDVTLWHDEYGVVPSSVPTTMAATATVNP